MALTLTLNTTGYIAILGWPVVSLAMFKFFKKRTAVLACVLSGWLLLPQAVVILSGVPDYDRATAVMLGIVLGILLFDPGRLFRFHLQRFDFPMVVLLLCPLASSLSNGLGFYDGISAILTAMILFGIPYLIGRLYFADRQGMQILAFGLILAVLCYLPLILYELKMSPQMQYWVYGIRSANYLSSLRLGGYRPMVFLRHGLELGLLVAAATMTATWLWRCRALPKFGWLSPRVVVFILLVLCLFCRALNGYGVLIMGLGALYLTKMLRTHIVIAFLLLIPPIYVTGRIIFNWYPTPLVEVVASIEPKRAVSLHSRFSHEIALIDKALGRPYLGWGGYDRNRADYLPTGARGKKSIVDSYWIIAFGTRGIVGLLSIGLVLIWPIARLTRRLPASQWSLPQNAPAAALSMVLLGFTIDCLVNAMISPIYFVIAGALIAYNPLQDKNKAS